MCGLHSRINIITMAASNEKAFQRLLKKDTLDWSVADVGLWLSNVGLEDYKLLIMNQAISCLELIDLTIEDLGSIGITKLGDKKKILREVRLLVDGKVNQDAQTPNFDTSSDTSGGKGSSSTSASSKRKSGKIDVKVTYRGLSERFLIDQQISLRELRGKVRKLFGKSLSLAYADPDGDQIKLRRDRDLRLSLQSCGGRLVLTASSKTPAQAASKT